MRRGFTLIEIIFTIVIMAGVFMTVPKILLMASKNESFAMRQDAFFNTISISMIASTLAWDENNTKTLNFLHTQKNEINCDGSTYIRVGSFLSSNAKNCQDNLYASIISSDGESDYLLYNDIDDFNNTSIDATANGKNKYQIKTTVSYIDLLNTTSKTFDSSNKKLTLDLSKATTSNQTTNVKEFVATIKYNGARAIDKNKNIGTFFYDSANIGQYILNKRNWQ